MGVEIAAAMAMAAPYLSAASMVIGGASAVTGYMAQSQQAKEQARANAATAESALQARNFQQQQLQTRALQERDAASERIFDSRVEALKGESAVAAAAGASGIQGNTVDALAREYWSASGRNEASIARNASNTVQQLAAESQGSQAQYEGRINAMPVARKPSLWGLGLGITNAVTTAAREQVQADRFARLGSRQGS